MNISFDLDNTLIPYGDAFPVTKGIIPTLLGLEGIRVGAKNLFTTLKKEGHSIHIYTTSYRNKFKIRLTFLVQGIRIGKIIQQNTNEKRLKALGINASKHPPTFGFDIHIDDSEGVKMEGDKYNFKTLIISPTDKYWHFSVLEQLLLT